MSLKCQSWVYQYSEARGNERLILLAIADEANDDGTNAYPGIATIAHKARVNERTTMRCIASLERDGRLIVIRPDIKGRGHHNTYVVVMREPAFDTAPGTVEEKGDEVSPFPSEDPQEKGDKVSPFNERVTEDRARVTEHRETPRNTATPYLDGSRPIDPETQEQTPSVASRPPEERRASAESVVQDWYNESVPAPVASFIGVVKLVERFLEAGYSVDQMARALREARCPTSPALLYVLRATPRQSVGDAGAEAARAWLEEQDG